MKSFSIGEALGFGWRATKENYRALFLWTLLMVVLQIVNVYVRYFLKPEAEILLLFTLLFMLLAYFLGIMGIKMSLQCCDNEEPSLDIGAAFSFFLPYLGSTILVSFFMFWPLLIGYIVMFMGMHSGSALFTIVGILVALFGLGYLIVKAVTFSLFAYVLVNEGAGPLEAIRRSKKITRGARWKLFWFRGVSLLITLLGMLLLGIGLFVTIPLVYIALAYVYRTLKAQTDSENVSQEAQG